MIGVQCALLFSQTTERAVTPPQTTAQVKRGLPTFPPNWPCLGGVTLHWSNPGPELWDALIGQDLIKPLFWEGTIGLSGNHMGLPQRRGDQRQIQQVYHSTIFLDNE